MEVIHLPFRRVAVRGSTGEAKAVVIEVDELVPIGAHTVVSECMVVHVVVLEVPVVPAVSAPCRRASQQEQCRSGENGEFSVSGSIS